MICRPRPIRWRCTVPKGCTSTTRQPSSSSPRACRCSYRLTRPCTNRGRRVSDDAHARARTHARTRIREYTHTRTHTHAHTHSPVPVQEHVGVHTDGQGHVQTGAYKCVMAHTRTRTHTRMPTHARTHARMHSCTHARTHALTRTRVHTHTHTYALRTTRHPPVPVQEHFGLQNTLQ
jgi:hypothetical protein